MKEFVDFPRLHNPAHEDINSYAAEYLFFSETMVKPGELREFASGLMDAAAAACYESGAKDIGHIKAYIEHSSGFLYADTTGTCGDINVEGKEGEATDHFRVVINSVIFGLDENLVREATEEALEKLSQRHGLRREPV